MAAVAATTIMRNMSMRNMHMKNTITTMMSIVDVAAKIMSMNITIMITMMTTAIVAVRIMITNITSMNIITIITTMTTAAVVARIMITTTTSMNIIIIMIMTTNITNMSMSITIITMTNTAVAAAGITTTTTSITSTPTAQHPQKRVYILENLGCAHCASKMEEQIQHLDGVESATITFATKQLRLNAADPDALLPQIRKICTSIESEVKVVPRNPKPAASADVITKIYLLENLGCAHCASKMEEQIADLDGISEATITFATKQLRVTAKDPDRYLDQIRKICTSIESEVKVVPRSNNSGEKTKTYILENLGCANCASKMEKQIADLDVFPKLPSLFATKQLRVTAKNPDRYLDQIRKICTSIESEVVVKEKDPKPKSQTAASETHPSSKKKSFSKEKIDTICIIIGAILFVAGEIMEHKGFADTATLPLFVIAYLALGGVIVVKAAKNISHGQVFDENFLMSVATLAAFAINDSAEAVGVMLFYRIGELFEEKAVERSRGQIMDAVDLRPEVVNLVVGDDIQVIPSEEAQVGDVLLVRPGDRIPLDGVIIEGSSRIDTSPITGEPVPVAVNEGDEITSGCVNTSGQLKIRVEKPLEESMVTRILDSVEKCSSK